MRTLASIAMLSTVAVFTMSAAKSPAALIIVSQRAGSTIQQGQALAVSVRVASGMHPHGVGILGQDSRSDHSLRFPKC